MKCPACNTINRDDRLQCYHCDADLTLLRTVILKAKQHYNNALEHAERNRLDEAIADLKTAVSIYNEFPQAHNVLGTLYAKQEKWELAIEQWQQTLELDPVNKKAADYFFKAQLRMDEPFAFKQARLSKQIATVLGIILSIILIWHFNINTLDNRLEKADRFIDSSEYSKAYILMQDIQKNKISYVHRVSVIQLQQKLDLQLNNQFNSILKDKNKGDFSKAIESLARLTKKGIPEPWLKKANQLKNELYILTLHQKIKASMDNYQKTKNYSSSMAILDQISRLPLSKKDLLPVTEAKNQLQAEWFAHMFASLNELYQKKQYSEALEIITELRKENLDEKFVIQINDINTKIQSGINIQKLASARDLLSKKKNNEFLAIAGEIELNYLPEKDKNWLIQQINKIKSQPAKPPKS